MFPINSCNGAALPRFGAAGLLLIFLAMVIVATAQTSPGWTSADIGAVGLAGSDSEASGTVTMRGAGADIWARADGFHFRFQPMSGDGAIVARITSTGTGNDWAKVGLMIREDLTPGAKNVMALITPARRYGLQSRSIPGADTTFANAGTIAVPQWLMLDRVGNTFTAYRSVDGNNWTPIASATVAMGSDVRVGLAVSSHNTAALQTATLDNVMRVGGTTPPPPPPPPLGAPAAPTNLQAGNQTASSVQLVWQDNSGDETGFAIERAPGGTSTFAQVGTTAANQGTFTDNGLTAATSYTYRVRALRDDAVSDYSNPTTITTLAAPASPSADWSSVDLTDYYPGGSAFSASSVTLHTYGGDIWGNADAGRYYFRDLTGDGVLTARVVSLYRSDPWAKAGIMIRSQLDPYGANAAMLLSAGNISAFQYRSAYPGDTSAINGPWVNPTYWVRLARSGDLITGSISPDGVNWTVIGSQTVALGATTHIGLVASSHSTVATDAVFDHITLTGTATTAAPPAAPSQYSMWTVSSSEISMTWKDNSSTETGFVIERSLDGTAFQDIATTAPNVTRFDDSGLMSGTNYYYRICAINAAGKSGYTGPAYVTTFGSPPPPPPPPPPSSATWTPQSWNAASSSTQVDESGLNMILRGRTPDIWGRSDGGTFVYQPLSGDGTITTRVDSLSYADPYSKAGLMFRASLDSYAANVCVVVTAQRGIIFHARAGAGEATTTVREVAGPQAPVMLRLSRTGNLFAAAYSTNNGAAWTSLGTVTVALPANAYRGPVATSHSTTNESVAAFSGIALQ